MTTTTMWTKTSTNTRKQIIQIYGDDNNNVIDVIAFIERSIENYIESILSINYEREQGQSGDHIWRPYTGAKKGKEIMLLQTIVETIIIIIFNDHDNNNDDTNDKRRM